MRHIRQRFHRVDIENILIRVVIVEDGETNEVTKYVNVEGVPKENINIVDLAAHIGFPGGG